MKNSILIIGQIISYLTLVNPAFSEVNDPPNIIIINVDDMGYGDLSMYGSPTIHTPELDKMAREGMKLTQFYVASSVCTPSRAALMTGSYPKRIGLESRVLRPNSTTGLNPEEETIAKLLKERGYATACIGKWHLGHEKPFLPINHGFDVFYGIPFSNDMSKKEQANLGNENYKWNLPLMNQDHIIELNPDQRMFTKLFTDKSVEFIKGNKDDPFFLYLAHPMPHVPIYASGSFKDVSLRGKYGDTVEELDWSVGEILNTLREYKLEENTLVVFTSDNGPWKQYKTDGGSAGPLRGSKGTTWEGGFRVPCLVWWPGHIKAASVEQTVVTSMDLLPTISSLCGSDLPDQKIDGRDVSRLLLGGVPPEEKPFFYYSKFGEIEGVRKGKYKLKWEGDELVLFDIEADISEEYDLSDTMPDMVIELEEMMTAFDLQLEREKRTVGIL